MAIEKMALVRFYGQVDSLNNILPQCMASGCFHPESVPVGYNVGGFSVVNEDNPYGTILSQLKEVCESAEVNLKQSNDSSASRNMSFNPNEVDLFIEKFKDELKRLSDLRTELEKFKAESYDALVFLEHFDKFNENLDDIIKSKYFKVRFGRLPKEGFEKLDFYNDKMLLFFSLGNDKHYHTGFYVTTAEDYDEVSDIFNSLNFERVWLPSTIHGTPESAKNQLRTMIAQTDEDLAELDAQTSMLIEENSELFRLAYYTLNRLNSAFSLRKYVSSNGSMFHLEGFVPEQNIEEFSDLFESIPGLEVTFQPPDSDSRLQAPTKLKNNGLFKPFEMFVEMYGLPGYNDFDPTPFLAVTYMLLFGIMFGDLGQGLLVSVLGFFLWKSRKMMIGRIMIRIGLCSAVFGTAYGSVFGFEHLLDPMFQAMGFHEKPLEVMSAAMTNNILLVAVGIGVLLIVITIALNIYQGIRNNDIERAIFGNNGVAGLIFYCSILAAVLSMLTGGPNLFTPAYIIGLMVVPVLAIFLKESLAKVINHEGKFLPQDESIGSWILAGIFELFEVVLSFLTNTLSFLRVGCFVISHAGMMMVVMSLSEMMQGVGSIFALVVGNLFVIGLEGFIAGIQVLRLQFYELFSHYYEGQGKAYEPLHD